MPASLTLKLTLAFLIVSLIGVVLVAVFSRLITEREFDRLTLQQAQSRFVTEITAYYQTNGTWQGIDDALGRPPRIPRPEQPGGTFPPPSWRLGLADQENMVVIPVGSFKVGDKVSPETVATGTKVEFDGQVVGTMILPKIRLPRDPFEEQYLARTNQTVLIAAVGSIIVALGFGVFLARTLTRPLRELTAASLNMATGDLGQAVPVRSEDELGQLAQAFNQMSRDLAEATRLRRQMTADIAHELRTPLAVISGYLEAMCEDDLEPTPTRLGAVFAEARQLKRLVADLRTLSLADAGELSLKRQQVRVTELLTRVADAHNHQASRQKITLSVQAEAALPEINADPDRLVQVLGNLVSNALRYTPTGGQIVLSARTQGEGVLLRVQDTGPGIPTNELPYIFHRLYRADRSRRQTEGESGLGLAIAKTIIEAHDGRIWAESALGQGTTFAITLPVRCSATR